jgi:putative MFS transporter
MTTPVSSGARLDRLPLSRFHWKILGLIAAGACIDAYDIYIAGGVGAAMLREGFSTLEQTALFVSAGFLGMVIGAALSGVLGDHLGRRAAYQFNLLLFGLASLAACFMPNIESLTITRFIMGIGLGAELVVAAGTLSEFIPPRYRGRWISLLALFVNSGLTLATIIGYAVIPTLGWRYMFAIAGVAAVIVWIMRHNMPESPRWLESRGRLKEAEETLALIEAEVEREHGPLPECPRSQNLEVPKVPFRVLFSRAMLPRTITAILTAVGINVAVYGFVAWLPTFFVGQGHTVVKSLGFTVMMSFGAPAGALLAYFLADKIGRAKGLVTFALMSIALGCIYPYMTETATIGFVGFCLVSCIYVVTTLGLFGYIPELFPTALRLRGTGVAGTCARTASMFTSYVTVLLFARFGITGVLAMVFVFLLMMVCAVCLLRLDTNQNSLEDIEPDMEPGVKTAHSTAVSAERI